MSDSFNRQLRYVVHRKLQYGIGVMLPVPPDVADSLEDAVEPVLPTAGYLELLVRSFAGSVSPSISADGVSCPLSLWGWRWYDTTVQNERAAVSMLRAAQSVVGKGDCVLPPLAIPQLTPVLDAVRRGISPGSSLSDGLGGSEQVD